MKALVMGGNGFIGSHVVDSLLTNGHSVRVFGRRPEKFRAPLVGVDYRLASFDDVPSLSEALEGVDVVYHFISTTVPSTSNKDPIYDVNSNLIGTIRLLNLMREQGVHRIVYLSSGGTVYGIPDLSPISEEHKLRPICSYGVVKVSIESYLQMYQYLYGIRPVILRVSNPYGERQGHAGVQGVVATFMRQICVGEPIEIWGDGSVIRDYIYVKDLAELCLRAGESETTGIYNAGSGIGRSVSQILSAVSALVKWDVTPVYKSRRSYDVPEVVLSVDKVKADFDWAPVTDLGDGLTRTWEWYNEIN